MAIWENPEVLSGISPTSQLGDVKPELGLCIIHQGSVPFEWALRFRQLKLPPFVFMANRNQPYDTAREQITRAVLSYKVKWVFHLDTDVLIPVDAVEKMIQWSEKFKLPVISGLYWAKKPGQPMPAAWINVGYHKEENRYDFAPADMKPHMNTGAIVPVDVVGAGCLLVNAEVFKKLDESDPKKPYFEWGLGRRDKDGKPLWQMSEDFYFCTRCKQELNIQPHVATPVMCDHVTTVYKRGSDGEMEIPTRV